MDVKPCIPIQPIFTTPFPSLSTEEPVDVKMAPLSRFQLEGVDLLDIHPDISKLFDKLGWREFFSYFSGHNVEVTRSFSLSLGENVAQIGNV